MDARPRLVTGGLAAGKRAAGGSRSVCPHPPSLYAAVLLLAAGTLMAHTSRATVSASLGAAIGIALKRRAEDRALEQRFGERWRAYAARVPAFVPRLTRARP
jgi:protein-S-isoprenylcysteine O-methyltransferase Ste14